MCVDLCWWWYFGSVGLGWVGVDCVGVCVVW